MPSENNRSFKKETIIIIKHIKSQNLGSTKLKNSRCFRDFTRQSVIEMPSFICYKKDGPVRAKHQRWDEAPIET